MAGAAGVPLAASSSRIRTRRRLVLLSSLSPSPGSEIDFSLSLSSSSFHRLHILSPAIILFFLFSSISSLTQCLAYLPALPSFLSPTQCLAGQTAGLHGVQFSGAKGQPASSSATLTHSASGSQWESSDCEAGSEAVLVSSCVRVRESIAGRRRRRRGTGVPSNCASAPDHQPHQ